MCGIFSIISNKGLEQSKKNIEKQFMLGQGRGPENSIFEEKKYGNNDIIFGFHRLAINGYKNEASEQPIKKDGCILICNGEIYNWDKLQKLSNSTCNTFSDCEIIIDLYRKYGPEQTLQMLDGVFAFFLYDEENNFAFIARDPLGIRPLFMWKDNASQLVISSEIKMGQNILAQCFTPNVFKPGTFIYTSLDNTTPVNYENITYYKNNSFQNNNIQTYSDAFKTIKRSLISAVKKRIENTDRDIACLLSGGLDSSLITSIVVNLLKIKHGGNPLKKIHTWSVGMEGSEDLKYAKIVANHLGTIHHEIKLTDKEFIEAIPETIRIIETNDTTTIRASVGNYLICKYIKKNIKAKVIFNGDGSDEVTGGYLYFHHAPDSIEFDKECRILLNDIHFFDVLRSDRTISCHGLEARTPFLDRNFVQTYLSIPVEFRNHNVGKHCEKYLLRKAFEEDNYLPKEILWRTKEAFSDGVSNVKKSWFEVIQDFASAKYNIENKKEAEQKYYDEIFTGYYGSKERNKNIIPYKWMPKFVDADDCSARTLGIYNNINKKDKKCGNCSGRGLVKKLDINDIVCTNCNNNTLTCYLCENSTRGLFEECGICFGNGKILL
jgi:asparagine synthase (glutamine-hydrolysing)